MVGVVLAALWLTPGVAAAHAELVAATPPDQARLDAPPSEIRLDFTEPVSAPSGAITVVGADGTTVPVGPVEQAGASVSAPVDALPEGGYVVTYRVVSADGHPIRGASTFSVGAAAPPDAGAAATELDQDDDRPWEVAWAVARWVGYLGTLLAAGGAVHLAVTEPGARTRRARLIGVAAAVGLAGVLAALPVQAALATGLGATALAAPGVAGDVLANGVGWSVAVVFVGLTAVTLGVEARRAGAASLLLLGGAALAVGGFAVTGHTTTADPRWLATGADVVHLAAGAVWFGGLVLVGLSLADRRADRDAAAAGHTVARFSALAAVAIVAVGTAGAVLGWSEVRSVDALTGTTYGRLLMAKVAIVAVVAAVGAYNRLRLVPAVARRDAGAGWRRLVRTVGFEASALVVAVALTAVLVNVTPARDAAAVADPPVTSVPLGEGTVEVSVQPGSGGREVVLQTLDAGGRPVDVAAEGLAVELTHPGQGLGPLERVPEPEGIGRYVLDATDLPLPGTWEVRVVARISRFEQVTATAEVTIGA